MDPSARIYSKFLLKIYDWGVLGAVNTFAWKCRTGRYLLPFYRQRLGQKAHLEIGVGTGYYPVKSIARLNQTQGGITLLDLNPNTLRFAETRLRAGGIRTPVTTIEQSCFEPLPRATDGKFDSVAMYYLFHCLPGAFPQKATTVFEQASRALAPGGTVFGATVLGESAKHNWLGSRLIPAYNKQGMFGNKADTEENLRKALEESFEEYKLDVVGVVALFEARKPKFAFAKKA